MCPQEPLTPATARLPKIAVVAVHGVGDQQPGGPVRAVGDLLLGAPGEPAPFVEEWVERAIRFPLEPVRVARRGRPNAPADGAAAAPGRAQGAAARLVAAVRRAFDLDERSRYARQRLRSSSGGTPAGEMSYEFMRAQLDRYQRNADGVPAIALETPRLEGRLQASGGSELADLHVHEMYWADLGRIGSGVLSVFGHLYQLLFHLPSLGRNTADFAAIESSGSRRWQAFMMLRSAAGRLLTLPVPILNLILVMASVVALSGALASQAGPVTGAVGALGGLGLTLLALWLRPPARALTWYLAPVAGAAAGLGIWCMSRQTPLHLLAIEGWILGAAAVALVLRKYANVRPGALGWGALFLLAFSVLLGFQLWVVEDSGLGNAATGLHILQVAIYLLMISWLLLAVCFALSLITGLFAVLGTPAGGRRRAFHATWTAHATLGLSSALVLILNLALWSAFYSLAGRLLPAGCIEPLSLWHFGPAQLGEVVCLPELARQMLLSQAGWGFRAALSAGALLLLGTVWGLLPSVLAEIRPPRTEKPERARRLGLWLCRGLPLIACCAVLLGPALIGGIAADLVPGLPFDEGQTEALLWAAGAAVLALIGGKAWLSAIGNVVGVMLEVDNYMREHPRESTPRARIAERFASLLRQLGRAREAGGEGYDAIVIVAHSQGTVIAADLLRFLHLQRVRRRQQGGEALDPELEWLPRKPIYLFTMGCPLRQLYGWCFPHLYDWAEPEEPWTAQGGATPIPADLRPDPAELGPSCRWLNAYRTGDYVGRSLWLADDAACAWMRQNPPSSSFESSQPTLLADETATRMEVCIGEGAHTHYWDATAVDVARLLKDLVTRAARLPAAN